MVDISSKEILSMCNNWNYGPFRRGGSANFAPSSRIMEEKESIGICNNNYWKYVQKFRKQDTSNSQTGKYFIKCFLELISWFLKPFTFIRIKREFEAKFDAQHLLKRPYFQLLHVERIPLLEVSSIFLKTVAPEPGLFERSIELLVCFDWLGQMSI